MLGVIPNLIFLKSYFTVSQLVNSYLKNPYLRKAFSIHPLLVGGDPHTTTSIYALIHYLERKWGVFFCMGGTGKIVSELKKLMIDCGINYFRDFIQPNLKFKIPNSEELIILKEVVSKLKEVEPSADADEFQTAIFSVGKNSVYKENIKEFFKLIYQVVFGQENGPRLGSFTKIYTKDKTLELFNSKLNV